MRFWRRAVPVSPAKHETGELLSAHRREVDRVERGGEALHRAGRAADADAAEAAAEHHLAVRWGVEPAAHHRDGLAARVVLHEPADDLADAAATPGSGYHATGPRAVSDRAGPHHRARPAGGRAVQ